MLTSFVLQMFRDKLDTVVGKIVSSIAPGGWFVTQNMTPDGGSDPECMSSMNLMTTLAARINHFIPERKLTDLLRGNGLSEITTGRSGPKGANLIIAARKSYL